MNKYGQEFLSLADDCLWQFAQTEKETREQALLRQLLSRLRPGDILSGDANVENDFLLARLLPARTEVAFEKKDACCIDFQKCDGKSGSKDGAFKLNRPLQRVDEPGAL